MDDWIEIVAVDGQRVSINRRHLIKVAEGPDSVTYVRYTWTYGDPAQVITHEPYADLMGRLTSHP